MPRSRRQRRWRTPRRATRSRPKRADALGERGGRGRVKGRGRQAVGRPESRARSRPQRIPLPDPQASPAPLTRWRRGVKWPPKESRGWPRQPAPGPTLRHARLLAAREEATVAIARVARMEADRGEEIPVRLRPLPPVLHVLGSPPHRRLSIVLPRERADRAGVRSRVRRSPYRSQFAVSGDLAGQRGTSAHSRNHGRTSCNREQGLCPRHRVSFRETQRPIVTLRRLPQEAKPTTVKAPGQSLIRGTLTETLASFLARRHAETALSRCGNTASRGSRNM